MESPIKKTEVTLNDNIYETISPTSTCDSKSDNYVLNISSTQPVANKASQKYCKESEELGKDTEVSFAKRNSTHGLSQSISNGTRDEKSTDNDTPTSLTQDEEDTASTQHVISVLPNPKISSLDTTVIGSPTDGQPDINSLTQITTGHTTKKGYSVKSHSISSDLANDTFPLWISSKKRKGKQLKLKVEDFNSDFTTKKQTGFATNRPVRWALTLENI